MPHPADSIAYRFDEWDKAGNSLVQTHAFIGEFEVAKVAWAQLINAKAGATIG